MSKPATTQVRAVRPGFFHVVREIDDVFEITGPVPKWCEAVGSKAAAAKLQEEIAPTDRGFKIKHMPPGNWAVVDKDGVAVGQLFKRDAADKDKAKADAQAEADRLNAGGQPAAAETVEAPGITVPQNDPEQTDLPDA